MKNYSTLARLARLSLLACALAAPAGLELRAQSSDALQQLDPVVVTATRTPAAPQTLGTAVDSLSAADLAREQTLSLGAALGGVAGAPAFASGQAGASTALFLRGADSNQVLFLVDGIRLNDANTDYNVFLSGARIFPGDTLEIAKGPQSTLYGSEAVGGVISLNTQKGAGVPSGQVSAEAGSFGTVQGAASAQGAGGPWAYNVALGVVHTGNARPDNPADTGNLAVRIDRAVTDSVAVGATVRGFASRYGDPGDEYTDDPNNDEREDNWIGTIFADVRPTENFSSHLTLGGQDRRFVSENPAPNPPYFDPSETTVETDRRAVADWQNTISFTPANRLVAGLTAEDETTKNDGFGNIDRRQTLFAVFADDEWSPVKNVYLTGGLRHDDYDTFGGAITGRLTAAWLVIPDTLKLRASYGTGFNAPSFLDLYGVATGYQGNPNLQPERSRGGDAGVDWYLPGKRGVLSATWFQTDYRDLIEYYYDFSNNVGTEENLDRARTRGVELSGKADLPGSFKAQIAYTWLQAEDITNAAPLLRRPHNSASADLWHDFGHGVSAGAGASYVGRRADLDALTYATVTDPSYTIVRVYAAWEVTKSLTLTARVENLGDKHYEPVNGYPALGRGWFGGAVWKF